MKRHIRAALLGAIALLPVTAEAEIMIGEVRTFAMRFCPQGWLRADGNLLPIQQYASLFSLIGTFYGGDGITNFALPDLLGRTTIGAGSSRNLGYFDMGETGGFPETTLRPENLPQQGDSVVYGTGPATNLAANTAIAMAADPGSPLATGRNPHSGQSVPFNIRDPYVAMTICVAYDGDYPQRP